MVRPIRLHVPGTFHHVTLRGNHQQPIFQHDGNRSLLSLIVERAVARYGIRVHAFCWMTNHLHFLIEVGTEPLGGAMRQIASEYARAYQKNLHTSGHLFERRYHARLIDVDAYFLGVLRYIHLNPVAARICASPDQYRWSSHNAYAGTSSWNWLTTEFAFRMLAAVGSTGREAYLRFMECDADDIADPLVIDSAPKLPEKPVARTTQLHPRAFSQTLDELIAEACGMFSLTVEDLRDASRRRETVRARGWIAAEAIKRRVASLSQVARAVGRDRKALHNAMRRLAGETD